MSNQKYTTVERIIAKIDNDFNPDNSDWIPRVAAWCNDAIMQLHIITGEPITKNIKVINNYAYIKCVDELKDLRVYSSNGCELKKISGKAECCNFSTGELDERSESINLTPDSISLINNKSNAPDKMQLDFNPESKSWPGEYSEIYSNYRINNKEKGYMIVNSNVIELNYDNESYITINYITNKTYRSERFGCELPVIPNIGVVVEAVTNYCMYKMLCRGYKHPVLNLQASQYGTNPYYMWINFKDEAERAIINNEIDSKELDDASKLFRSNAYIHTFDPRHNG